MLENCHNGGVTLIGASDPQPELINRALRIAPALYCADGGAKFAPKPPIEIIGDMDSIDDNNIKFQDVKRRFIRNQDTTDFDKCLDEIQADFFICLGFTGGRMDHHFASYSTMARMGAKKVILVSDLDFAILASGQLWLKLGKHIPFALFPLTPSRVVTKGLRWDLNGEEMAIDGLISTSNQTRSETIEVDVKSGLVTMILPNTHLETVVAQMTR